MVPWGPTVRRLHREREARERERRSARWHRNSDRRRRSGHRPLPATAPFRATRASGPSTSPRNCAEIRLPPRFPLKMEALLEIERGRDLLVLDGRIFRIEWRPIPSAGLQRRRTGCRRRIRAEGRLKERLVWAMHHYQTALDTWARTVFRNPACTDEFDSIPGMEPARNPQKTELFIHSSLIPFLKRKSERKQDRARTGTIPVQAPEEVVCSRMESHFAFIGNRWYGLVPFFGDPRPGQLRIRVEEEQFVAVKSQARIQALERYDTLLREAVLKTHAPLREEGRSRHLLFRNDRYTIVATAGGRYILCRHIPPYAIEGPDHKLYYFDQATLGIPISIPNGRSEFPSVWVMHPYRHMFLRSSDRPDALCMPRPASYYEELVQMPMEEVLVHHLESARMTLCAGYLPGSVPYHSIQSLGRPTLSREEAAKRDLPIYWNRRSASGETDGLLAALLAG